jgi:anti-sigma factor RsiW
MNCNNFEAIISDLAREQMLEAHTRESALSHMEECKACAARLEDERALTGGLRSLAASMQNLEAPASVETNLLAKFRERKTAQPPTPVVVEMPRRAASWRRFIPQAAAAAVLLMFAIGGATVMRLRQERATDAQSKPVVSSNNNKAIEQAKPSSSDAAAAVKNDGEVEGTAAGGGTEGGNGISGQGQKLSQREMAIIMGATPSARRPSYTNVPRNRINGSGMSQTGGEIATDFMPVSYGDNLNEIDNGRIVRVEMPRSALAQFGLPVNMERANERIKADVVIGDDGMARAIRFVR